MKRLSRSFSDAKIAGVCGGLGEYFNLDPAWFRFGFLVSLICYGVGLVPYIILWIVLPEK